MMFIQVIQGQVRDRDAARATLERWRTEVEPGAEGWLGGTFGFTDSGMLVAVIRFSSPQAARRNSQRPEQQAWWRQMQRHMDGPVTFHDCGDVSLMLSGGSDEAGFVQVIQGRVRDRDRIHVLTDQATSLISRHRPDILGATLAIDDEGFMTETIAFRSESQAREAERGEIPAAARKILDEETSLIDGMTYIDLHQPWFASR